MQKGQTILRKAVNILLICILALSITPATVFHNLFLDHTDYAVAHNHTHESELAQAGINCHFDCFVCQTPFVSLITPSSPGIQTFHFTFVDPGVESFYSQHHFFAELRGPPAIA
ncbi:hypothetical protein [Segetibacter aerophilus]|uniref:DUF2946 domain-containing protein n=1 Tax=Segetibacter aerophilus TaxID=670293 RepID=A0A512BDK6_9BACT|nr:hypothetical protein [Segetibacter aerophilus]GEO10024.1 hypothetical protein SAE01_25200 [Segetibacter aerophilus]